MPRGAQLVHQTLATGSTQAAAGGGTIQVTSRVANHSGVGDSRVGPRKRIEDSFMPRRIELIHHADVRLAAPAGSTVEGASCAADDTCRRIHPVRRTRERAQHGFLAGYI